MINCSYCLWYKILSENIIWKHLEIVIWLSSKTTPIISCYQRLSSVETRILTLNLKQISPEISTLKGSNNPHFPATSSQWITTHTFDCINRETHVTSSRLLGKRSYLYLPSPPAFNTKQMKMTRYDGWGKEIHPNSLISPSYQAA